MLALSKPRTKKTQTDGTMKVVLSTWSHGDTSMGKGFGNSQGECLGTSSNPHSLYFHVASLSRDTDGHKDAPCHYFASSCVLPLPLLGQHAAGWAEVLCQGPCRSGFRDRCIPAAALCKLLFTAIITSIMRKATHQVSVERTLTSCSLCFESKPAGVHAHCTFAAVAQIR